MARYKVVCLNFNELSAYDAHLNATINNIDLGVDPGDRIEIVAVSNDFPVRAKAAKAKLDIGGGVAVDGDDFSTSTPRVPGEPAQLGFDFPEYAKSIM